MIQYSPLGIFFTFSRFIFTTFSVLISHNSEAIILIGFFNKFRFSKLLKLLTSFGMSFIELPNNKKLILTEIFI